MSDPVNSPRHYNRNGIEVIDVIETYAKSDFRLANVLKYVCRCEYKGKKLEDLRKAAWYLNRVINEIEEKQRAAAAELSRLNWEEVDTAVYVQPSPERIAGDDSAAQSIKAFYYNYDPREAISTCANPACRMVITSADSPIIAVMDDGARHFCSMVCAQLMMDR